MLCSTSLDLEESTPFVFGHFIVLGLTLAINFTNKMRIICRKSMPLDARFKETFRWYIFMTYKYVTHILFTKIMNQSLTLKTKWPCV